MRKWLFLFLPLFGAPPPADISFFLADVKFNERQGAKICEVQQGNISLFKGFDFIFKRKGVIGERLCRVLSQYNDTFWYVDSAVNFNSMRPHLLHNKWLMSPTLYALLKNPKFLKHSASPVKNPHDIRQYRALVYTSPYIDIEEFRRCHKGVLLMDAVNFPYLLDKYKMSALFLGDERLEKVKPKWQLYPKKYTHQLAGQIIKDIGSDLLVIKPRGTSEGRGVIIIPQEQLDAALKKMMFDRRSHESDSGYKFWQADHSDSFLVEEYIPSDPIYPAHLGGKPYNATLRVVFILAWHMQKVHLHYLGAYWIIPEKAINEEGSIHEKSKAYVLGTSYYCDVAKETLAKVEEQLREPLMLMYQRMLEQD
jgi:hypothetical protein